VACDGHGAPRPAAGDAHHGTLFFRYLWPRLRLGCMCLHSHYSCGDNLYGNFQMEAQDAMIAELSAKNAELITKNAALDRRNVQLNSTYSSRPSGNV